MVSPLATTCVRMPGVGCTGSSETGRVEGVLLCSAGVCVAPASDACDLAALVCPGCGIGGALVIIGTLPRFSASIHASSLSLSPALANGSVGLVVGAASAGF